MARRRHRARPPAEATETVEVDIVEAVVDGGVIVKPGTRRAFPAATAARLIRLGWATAVASAPKQTAKPGPAPEAEPQAEQSPEPQRRRKGR